jgi:hypothetical protein
VQLALLNPVQIFPESTSIRGARLNLLYGANENLDGVDAGLINRVTDEVGGIQLGVANLTEGAMTGAQLGFLANEAGRMRGLQLLALGSRSESIAGVQWAGVAVTNSLSGLQVATGVSAQRVRGVQIGLLVTECSGELTGIQIGALVNFANGVTGLQLGLLNIDPSSRFPVTPLLRLGW